MWNIYLNNNTATYIQNVITVKHQAGSTQSGLCLYTSTTCSRTLLSAQIHTVLNFLQCSDSWLGDRKGIRPVTSWVLVCWRWWLDWSFARLIVPVVIATSIILSSIRIHNGDILVPAYPACSGNWPLSECPVVNVVDSKQLQSHRIPRTPQIAWISQWNGSPVCGWHMWLVSHVKISDFQSLSQFHTIH